MTGAGFIVTINRKHLLNPLNVTANAFISGVILHRSVDKGAFEGLFFGRNGASICQAYIVVSKIEWTILLDGFALYEAIFSMVMNRFKPDIAKE